jgi:hypothetical protein
MSEFKISGNVWRSVYGEVTKNIIRCGNFNFTETELRRDREKCKMKKIFFTYFRNVFVGDMYSRVLKCFKPSSSKFASNSHLPRLDEA